MGFARASLVLLVTLPGCGLLLDTQTPEDPHVDVHVALDAATPADAFEASDAPGLDAYADDAFANDAGRDAWSIDAPGDASARDASAARDASRDASFDASFDAGADAFDPCPMTFCGPGGETMGLPSVVLSAALGAIDLDVSEDGTRIAILTGLQTLTERRVILFALEGGAWMERLNNAANSTCLHVAVSDTADRVGMTCAANVLFLGDGAVTVPLTGSTAIASGGGFFAVTSGRNVRVYDPAVGMGPLPLPIGTGACTTATTWAPDGGGSTVVGVAMHSAPFPWACDARPNLVAGSELMALGVHRISSVSGFLAECPAGACCSTPATTVDALHGTDLAVLGPLVVSASDSGRPRFVGIDANRPSVRDRAGGPIVSVSLGASVGADHFVLGSIHLPSAGRAGAWLQQEAIDSSVLCESERRVETQLFIASDLIHTLSKIRISDCDASGYLTAAVLETPVAVASGSARVFRVRCPAR